MKRVRIFLRTELFSLTGGKGHVPVGVVIVEGTLRETDRTGLTVEAASYKDAHGRPLEGKPTVLILPSSKVDHLLVLEE